MEFCKFERHLFHAISSSAAVSVMFCPDVAETGLCVCAVAEVAGFGVCAVVVVLTVGGVVFVVLAVVVIGLGVVVGFGGLSLNRLLLILCRFLCIIYYSL